MVAIDPDHRLPMFEGRRWLLHGVSDLVFGLTKDEILVKFRPKVAKEKERAALDLITKAYAKLPLRYAHARDLLAAINEVHADKNGPEYPLEDVLIPAYFMIDGLAAMLKDLGLTAVSFHRETGLAIELIEDLEAGARTTLYTALLVMRIINRLRHDRKLGWIDPRKRILTDVRRGKEKLKVAVAGGTLVEKAPYDAWMPHKGVPVDLRPEDRPLPGQSVAEDDNVVTLRS